jgi:predicted anti-sigma-YlaC factor YlaD
MSAGRCEREDELLTALGRGFVYPELDAHLEACSSCSELRLVAGGLLDERVRAVGEAPVPSPETMWWRLQMRQQREAQARARRSLLIGQAATLAVAMVLIAALLGAEIAVGVREVAASIRLSTPLLLALASWILLAPIAGWVAIRQK